MRNIETVVQEYLSKQTEYAVQIVGNWGNGKTHFFKHTLEDSILRTKVVGDNRKNYKPIYISLFGLKSIEDVATKIVVEFYQSTVFKGYFKEKKRGKNLRITQSVLKIGLRGFLNFNKLSSVNDYIADIQSVGRNVLDSNELVICFDDLERTDSALSLEDLTGYINSLADEGVKVLIITNEDILLKFAGEKYKTLKEKIIGVTVSFIPNTESILNGIIDNRYSGYLEFQKFLKDHLDVLSNVSASTENNFRNVIYALDCMQLFYSQIKNNILDVNHEIKPHVERHLKAITWTGLAFAIEYKSSIISYNDIDSFRNRTVSILNSIPKGSNFGFSEKPISTQEQEKVGYNAFSEKYKIPYKEYFFFESLFKYLTGYEEFHIHDFINEFRVLFHLDRGDILPQYKVLKSLHYWDFVKLTDNEYKAATLALIDYASKGEYALADYLSVMHFSERFDNVMDLNLDEVSQKIKEGIKKSIGESNELEFSQFEMSLMENPVPVLKEIYEFGKNEIKLERERRKMNESMGLFNLFESDIKQFLIKYNSEFEFREEVDKQLIMNSITLTNLIVTIQRTDNRNLNLLKLFLENRYNKNDLLSEELDRVKALIGLLSEYLLQLAEEDNTKLRSYFIGQIKNVLSYYVVNHSK